MNGWRHKLRVAAFAVRGLPAIGLALGLAVACSQPVPDTPEATGAGAATDRADIATAPGTATPGETAGAATGESDAALAGGLEPAPDVQSDPALAIDAPPPGRATARWGRSGRDIDGKSPWRSLAYDGIHQRDSDAIGVLQEPRSALRGLPRANSGNFIDWAAALRDGLIRPRARTGGQGQMEVLDLDIVLADTKNMPVVTFPHRTHTEWLSCRNCHDWLFKAQLGANDISMTDIARGRACGLCHGKVAFPATECFRCHDGPRPTG
ncbi:MAG: c(7)-type cytochrome triheme domain-containing protein [Paracoccaceae bacterium]